MKKFALFPKLVNTWRPKGTKALIWLQTYYTNDQGNYCIKLGFFSIEF